MSAESSRQRQASQTVVLPQPVTDKSIIDSVAGFIHEVVPPAYTNVLQGENKERITWARFERPDLFDPFIFSESADIDAYENAPLLLIIGYNVGAKIWSVSINGEATEVLSLTDSVIKCLRLLPTPLSCSVAESCLKQDLFAHKRPLIALCDNAGSSVPFCLVNFVSLRTGEQVKAIQFKTQVCDIQANRRSIAIVFPERIAVFDAFTLEDQLTVTTCFPSPSINPNPVALGSRWLAYAEKQLILQKRSRGGSEGEGVQSYTATVLQAAKTLSKGLREFSGSVTSSLTGTGTPVNGSNSAQPGIITILDVESSNGKNTKDKKGGEIIAHYIAHSEPIVAMNFDPSGMLLVTADKRGHRFHVFRINPHVAGSASASVHHLYILYRGDTTARVQDISFSNDSRWVAVSSLRGTTHVFPITPYGGSVGLRTHNTPHVVNKLSRFHRSAGLTNDGRNSPILYECTQQLQMLAIPNPCLPPFPSPIVITPLAQLRTYPPGIPATRGHEDISTMIKVAACFAPPRAWLSTSQETVINNKSMKRAVDSLFIITCHANLIQYDLDPKHVVGVTKDRICDNTQIELGVEAKAEWPLVNSSSNTQPPLNASNPLLLISRPFVSNSSNKYQNLDADERWLSQVEIVTHAGPHRRLWMGPQFTFKTFSSSTGSAVPIMDAESGSRLNRSSPVNMPLSHNPIVPVFLESGSSSSFEQSPCLLDMCGSELEKMEGEGDSRLQEDLADAMQEGPGMAIPSDTGGGSMRARASVMARQVNPLGTVITLSEGVSLAACIKTPDSNLKISKVVCCEKQSSHLPSSFDSPVNLDLSINLSEPGTDLNVQEKIIYIDSSHTSSESNTNSSSTSVDVNTNTSQMVTVVELASKTNKSNSSKISSNSIKASSKIDDSESPCVSQKDIQSISKASEENISTQSEKSHKTMSGSSRKNLKSEPPKALPREEASVSSKPSKSKSKKEKVKGNKVSVESPKQEDPGEIKEITQTSCTHDLANSELLLKTENEPTDFSTNSRSQKSDKGDDLLPLPIALAKNSKKKKKETIQPVVNLPKSFKGVEKSPKRDGIPADTIIISTYSSEEETLDEKFESVSLEEQKIRQDDPVIIRSHGVMYSIFDEHFKHPSVLEVPAALSKSELVPETLLEKPPSEITVVSLPVVEPCLEIPCYVEKTSEETTKPSTRSKKSRKGKASNPKENNQNLETQDSSANLSVVSTSDFSEENPTQNNEKDSNISESFCVESSPDFVTDVNSSLSACRLSDNQSYSEVNTGKKTENPLSFDEDTGGDPMKLSITASEFVNEKLNLVEDGTLSCMPIEPIEEMKDPQDTQLLHTSKVFEKTSKKRRGRKSKSNQNTVKEEVKIDITPTLSYASVSKSVAENPASETDSATTKVPSSAFPENYDYPAIEAIEQGHQSNRDTTCESENKGDSAPDDQFKSNLLHAFDDEVDSTESKISLKETDAVINSETIKSTNDAETEALSFELQLNTQEPNSLNEDFLSLTAEDINPCNMDADDEEKTCNDQIQEDEIQMTNLTEQLLPSKLIESASDFFIPHPLCSDDETSVDYVQITSMIVEDNLCQEFEPDSASDNFNTLEPKLFEYASNDAEFEESMVAKASNTCESGELADDLLEFAEKPHMTAVDDPLKISELMPESDNKAIDEPCLAESIPAKKEGTSALSNKKNRKEKGRKGRGRR